MRNLKLATIFSTAILMLLGIQAASWAKTLTVPKGTDVTLTFDQSLSSKTAKVGDEVKFHVAEPVMINGKTVIKEGAPVTGTITKVDKRGHFGVNAAMRISLDSVRGAGGVMIPLEPKSKGNVIGGK